MRIGYFADGPWSHLALKKITNDQRFEVVFIVPRFNTKDQILLNLASELKIELLDIKDVNNIDSINLFAKYNADLFVSMSYDQILKKDIINLPDKGFINCHAGNLPFYRGRNTLNWALINGEDYFGVSVHYIDEGIDTGDLILQTIEEITDKDNYATLLDRAIILCSDLLYKSISKIFEQDVNPIKQSSIDPIGSYCRKRKDGDEWINWYWSSRDLFNFVRGITIPGPMARALYKDNVLLIKSIREIPTIENQNHDSGKIIKKSKNSIFVATGDKLVEIQNSNILFEKSKQIANIEFRVGDKFSANF